MTLSEKLKIYKSKQIIMATSGLVPNKYDQILGQFNGIYFMGMAQLDMVHYILDGRQYLNIQYPHANEYDDVQCVICVELPPGKVKDIWHSHSKIECIVYCMVDVSDHSILSNSPPCSYSYPIHYDVYCCNYSPDNNDKYKFHKVFELHGMCHNGNSIDKHFRFKDLYGHIYSSVDPDEIEYHDNTIDILSIPNLEYDVDCLIAYSKLFT